MVLYSIFCIVYDYNGITLKTTSYFNRNKGKYVKIYTKIMNISLKELVQKGGQKEPRSSRNERLEDRNVWC